MSLFKKLFGNESSDEDKDRDQSPFNPDAIIPADELFTLNFKKMEANSCIVKILKR